ncbi:hypothetical protein MSAN_01935100 [Mycena sanguinolenta]|uniref:MYND-type domain-containing protein n=1 Tax=Mycena sanguinolenta TaxID=230812 RepID=A0A8H7CQH7_9AGAR|nr:hypothetical protein MSAN_01935100 [Mycena sanguinolenta]
MSLSAEILVHCSCATCYKPETEELKHKRCGSCRKTAYCSKECQKEHWPIHKQTCQLQRENRAFLPARGTEARVTLSDIKKWFSKHTQLLVYAATNAMNLHDRANVCLIKTHMLVVVLEPAPSGIHEDFVYKFAALCEIGGPACHLAADARAAATALAGRPDEGGRYGLIMHVSSGTAPVYFTTISVDLGTSLQHVRRLGPPDSDWKAFLQRAINKTLEAKDRMKILRLQQLS